MKLNKNFMQMLVCLCLILLPLVLFSADKKPGFMGIYSEDIKEEMVQKLKLKNSNGLLITGLNEKANAYKYGLRTDDVIIKIGDYEITNKIDFSEALKHFYAGDEVKIVYIRNGEEKTISFVFGERPAPPKSKKFALKGKQKKQIEFLMNVLQNSDKVMCNLAIGKGKKVLYTHALGSLKMDAKGHIASNNETKYRIGSISKMFTSAMVFQMIEEGKLTLDTKLKEYYPQIPNSDQITIGQMLSHQSGIYSVTNDENYLNWCTTAQNSDFIINKILASKPAFQPGEKIEYSNSNYILLSYIIEKLDKGTYARSLENRITSKLQLKNTYFGGKINAENNEAFSYKYIGNWEPEIETDMSIPQGAGSIVSTPSDLVVFIEALFNGKLIQKESLKQMIQIKEGFGYGIFEFNIENQVFYGHTGGIDGFTSILIYNPKDQYACAVVSNGTTYPASNIAFNLTDIVYQRPFDMPKFSQSIKLENPEKYVGVFLHEESKSEMTVRYRKGVFTTQMTGQQEIPVEAVAEGKFSVEIVGAVLVFDAEAKVLTLYQNGMVIPFVRIK